MTNSSIAKDPAPTIHVDLPETEDPPFPVDAAAATTAVPVTGTAVYDPQDAYGNIGVMNQINPRSLNNRNDGDTSSDEGSMAVGNDDTENMDDSYSGIDSPSRDFYGDSSPYTNNFDSV
jgi:hypothetical protein